MSDTPRIYVACLASYNAGTLHGEWIDADQDPESIEVGIQTMLEASPAGESAEEWAIHDSENFMGVEIGENESLETISELGQGLADHGEAYAAYVKHVGLHYATTENFSDRFLGTWSSLAEYAESVLEDQLSALPRDLRNYFDFERYGRDLDLSGDIDAIEGSDEVFIFSPG